MQKKLSIKAKEIASRFGDGEEFMKKYNPDLQTETAFNKKRAFTSKIAPTINEVREVYGEKVCNVWIMAQIERINDFTGVEKKLTEDVMLEQAKMLQAEPGIRKLKVSEFMYFIHRLKMGKYGSFYGVVDAMVINKALDIFLQEKRNYIYDLEEEKKRIAREKMFEGSISRESYESIKKRAETDIDAFKQLFKCFPNDKPIEEYWEDWKQHKQETEKILIEYNEKEDVD